jgi:membrane protein DedA with SNARE-associated domain
MEVSMHDKNSLKTTISAFAFAIYLMLAGFTLTFSADHIENLNNTVLAMVILLCVVEGVVIYLLTKYILKRIES